MKTLFFYAAESSAQSESYTRRLAALPCCQGMVVLPGGCRLQAPGCLLLRSGDIMVLFAGSPDELNDLLAMADSLEEFRVVLVLPDLNASTLRRAAGLKPRFAVCCDNGIGELALVLEKMLRCGRERVDLPCQAAVDPPLG